MAPAGRPGRGAHGARVRVLQDRGAHPALLLLLRLRRLAIHLLRRLTFRLLPRLLLRLLLLLGACLRRRGRRAARRRPPDAHRAVAAAAGQHVACGRRKRASVNSLPFSPRVKHSTQVLAAHTRCPRFACSAPEGDQVTCHTRSVWPSRHCSSSRRPPISPQALLPPLEPPAAAAACRRLPTDRSGGAAVADDHGQRSRVSREAGRLHRAGVSGGRKSLGTCSCSGLYCRADQGCSNVRHCSDRRRLAWARVVSRLPPGWLGRANWDFLSILQSSRRNTTQRLQRSSYTGGATERAAAPGASPRPVSTPGVRARPLTQPR